MTKTSQSGESFVSWLQGLVPARGGADPIDEAERAEGSEAVSPSEGSLQGNVSSEGSEGVWGDGQREEAKRLAQDCFCLGLAGSFPSGSSGFLKRLQRPSGVAFTALELKSVMEGVVRSEDPVRTLSEARGAGGSTGAAAAFLAGFPVMSGLSARPGNGFGWLREAGLTRLSLEASANAALAVNPDTDVKNAMDKAEAAGRLRHFCVPALSVPARRYSETLLAGHVARTARLLPDGMSLGFDGKAGFFAGFHPGFGAGTPICSYSPDHSSFFIFDRPRATAKEISRSILAQWFCAADSAAGGVVSRAVMSQRPSPGDWRKMHDAVTEALREAALADGSGADVSEGVLVERMGSFRDGLGAFCEGDVKSLLEGAQDAGRVEGFLKKASDLCVLESGMLGSGWWSDTLGSVCPPKARAARRLLASSFAERLAPSGVLGDAALPGSAMGGLLDRLWKSAGKSAFQFSFQHEQKQGRA